MIQCDISTVVHRDLTSMGNTFCNFSVLFVKEHINTLTSFKRKAI